MLLIFDTSCSTVASGGIRVNGPSTRISSDATVLQLIRQLHRFLTKTKTKTKNKAVEPFFLHYIRLLCLFVKRTFYGWNKTELWESCGFFLIALLNFKLYFYNKKLCFDKVSIEVLRFQCIAIYAMICVNKAVPLKSTSEVQASYISFKWNRSPLN